MQANNLSPRLKDRYTNQIIPKMMEIFGFKNKLRVPRLKKIVVSMGIGEGAHDTKLIDSAMDELGVITGQRPVICRAKKAIANFRIRKGNAIGCKVTLRGRIMYEFLDRLVNVALPRIRDFRGVSPDAFDENGNYNFGITDQTIFPEIEVDKVQRTQGMNVALVTNARKKEEARELLRLFGMPFKSSE